MKSHFFNPIKKKQMDVYFCMLPMLPQKGMKLSLSEDISWLWHFRTKYPPIFFRGVVQEPEKGLWISRKLLLLLVLKYARLSFSYTGCDAVSAFAVKGKAKSLKLLTKTKLYQGTCLQLGYNNGNFLQKSWTSWKLLLVKSMLPRHQHQPHVSSVLCQEGEIQCYQLPPCRDCLVKHALRANYKGYGGDVWNKMPRFQIQWAKDGL